MLIHRSHLAFSSSKTFFLPVEYSNYPYRLFTPRNTILFLHSELYHDCLLRQPTPSGFLHSTATSIAQLFRVAQECASCSLPTLMLQHLPRNLDVPRIQ